MYIKYITGKPAASGEGCSFGGGISEAVIERYLLDNLHILLLDYAAELKAAAHKTNNGYMLAVKQFEDKLVRLKDIYLDGIIDKNTYKADYEKIKKQLAEITDKSIKQKQAPKAMLMVLNDDNFASTYEKLDRQHRRELWQSLIKRITILRRPEDRGKPYTQFKIEFM